MRSLDVFDKQKSFEKLWQREPEKKPSELNWETKALFQLPLLDCDWLIFEK